MTTETTNRKDAKAPKYHAFHVTEAREEGSKSRWNRIGSFFAHDDGQGGTLVLDSLPISFDGRIVLRTPKAE